MGKFMAASSAKKWWKNAIIYQIYPRTFCDSNGDNIGDIPGIISKLHYLKELGVDVIALGPIFPSPRHDSGYDTSDFRAIDPDLGTMEDFERLISRAKRVGIKVMMDICIACTSDEHQWFKKALAGDEKYRNYYYLSAYKRNNWRGIRSRSAWNKAENGEWYLSVLGKNQPDLNWNNPDVYEEMADAMKFWLDKGVAGFRLDSVNIIYKNSLADGGFNMFVKGGEHYLNTKGCLDILRRLNHDVWSKHKCFIVGEGVYIMPDDSKHMCDGGVDAVFFCGRIDSESKFIQRLQNRHNNKKLIKLVDKGQKTVANPINYVETGDNANYVKFFGNDKINCLNFSKVYTGMHLALMGVPFINDGEYCRDPKVEDDPTSLYSFTSKMIEFRKNSKALSEGVYHIVAAPYDVLIFTREAKEERLYIYCNLTPSNRQVEFYGDRIVFSTYDIESLEPFFLKPYEFRIIASNI